VLKYVAGKWIAGLIRPFITWCFHS